MTRRRSDLPRRRRWLTAAAMVPMASCGSTNDAAPSTEPAVVTAPTAATTHGDVVLEPRAFAIGDSRFFPDDTVPAVGSPRDAVAAAAAFLSPGTARVTVQLGRYSNDSFGVDGDPARFVDSPVWVVTYHDVVQEAEGPAGVSLPAPDPADTHVIVDAATGEAVLALTEG